MVPLYAARVSDLGPGDFVHVECTACRHGLMIAASTLTHGLRLGPDVRITDLEPRMPQLRRQGPRRRLDSPEGCAYIDRMNLDLTDAETTALRTLLRQTIDGDRYPLSPRLRPYKAILAKIDPTTVRPAPPPLAPAKPYVPSSVMQKKNRRR
jgi:hypothetical protein